MPIGNFVVDGDSVVVVMVPQLASAAALVNKTDFVVTDLVPQIASVATLDHTGESVVADVVPQLDSVSALGNTGLSCLPIGILIVWSSGAWPFVLLISWSLHPLTFLHVCLLVFSPSMRRCCADPCAAHVFVLLPFAPPPNSFPAGKRPRPASPRLI